MLSLWQSLKIGLHLVGTKKKFFLEKKLTLWYLERVKNIACLI